MATTAIESLLKVRSARLKRRGQMQRWLKAIGRFLPTPVSLWLARFHPRFGYLLLSRGSFVTRQYLGDLSFNVDVRYDVERQVLSDRYEEEVLSAIRRFLPKGGLAIDVGANSGALTLALAKQAGPQGLVFAFEPGPPFFQRLKQNLLLNPSLSSGIEPLNLALGETEGTLLWHEDPKTPGNAWCLGDQGTPIPVVTLDEWMQKRGVPRLDLMKIDTEGMELEILKGARETLTRFRPVLILETLLDFETIRNRPIRKELQDFLDSLGYDLLCLGGDRDGKPTRYPALGANSLAVPKSPSPPTA